MLQFTNLGTIEFLQARTIQEKAMWSRIRGECLDTIFFCEHPATLSLGKRTQLKDLEQEESFFLGKGYQVVRASRGGSVTYHGPGQLVIYPVISLRARRLGVKDFVVCFLQALSEVVSQAGIESEVSVAPVGLLTKGTRQKLAACGLQIVHGVTNHGFSLNVSCDLDGFQGIVPCGERDLGQSSMLRLAEEDHIRFDWVCDLVRLELEKLF